MTFDSKDNKFKVMITDYAWPSLNVENSVLSPIANLVPAHDRSEDTFIELARDADAILFNWAQVTEEVVKSAEQCLILCRYGVGIDNAPVDLATKLGILVTNIPDYCIDEVTDHAMGLLISFN